MVGQPQKDNEPRENELPFTDQYVHCDSSDFIVYCASLET